MDCPNLSELYEQAALNAKINVLEKELSTAYSIINDLKSKQEEPKVEPTHEDIVKSKFTDLLSEMINSSTGKHVNKFTEIITELLVKIDKMSTEIIKLNEDHVITNNLIELLLNNTNVYNDRQFLFKFKSVIYPKILSNKFHTGASRSLGDPCGVLKLKYDKYTINIGKNKRDGSNRIYRVCTPGSVSKIDGNTIIEFLNDDLDDYTVDTHNELVKLLDEWMNHLEKFPNTNEKFRDVLVKHGLVK